MDATDCDDEGAVVAVCIMMRRDEAVVAYGTDRSDANDDMDNPLMDCNSPRRFGTGRLWVVGGGVVIDSASLDNLSNSRL